MVSIVSVVLVAIVQKRLKRFQTRNAPSRFAGHHADTVVDRECTDVDGIERLIECGPAVAEIGKVQRLAAFDRSRVRQRGRWSLAQVVRQRFMKMAAKGIRRREDALAC